MPQSMHRRACWETSPARWWASWRSYTSRQSPTRSSTGRLAASTLATFKKPNGSATGRLHDRGVDVAALRLGHPRRPSHLLVVGRHDLDELRAAPWPIGEQRTRHRALGVTTVLCDDAVQPCQILGFQLLQGHHV